MSCFQFPIYPICWQTIQFLQAVVSLYNYQQYRHIQPPGWKLGWMWQKKEIIWKMIGAQATEQGDCSKFKAQIPHCCKTKPEVVDLLPGTPYDTRIANCCKGGVLNSWAQDSANAVASFQVNVGQAGTSSKSLKLPVNFTLKAPGPGYTCGPAKIVRPTKFISDDGRRSTQALRKNLISMIYYVSGISFWPVWHIHDLPVVARTFSILVTICVSLCRDMEFDMYILAISRTKISNMLRFAVVVLQRYYC